MSYLQFNRKYNLPLFTRNEGKIKSYESCSDVRAWSHDKCKRSRYLREWIKCDMPLCVIPVATLLGFFRAMTCKKGGKATPRCHPDCRSKVILDSVISSCEAIKDCLKADESLEKFFIEEELETSHWPCERCLEILKSVRMFWKIILEKVFAVNLTKSDCYDSSSCCTAESVRDMARIWQKDMVQQAMFVKVITPELLCDQNSCKKPCIKKFSSCHLSSPCSEGDARISTRKGSRVSFSPSKCYDKKRDTVECPSNSSLKRCKTPPKCCKSICARVSCVDVACDPVPGSEEVKLDLSCLQKCFNLQKKELEQLKKENAALKLQLQNTYKGCKWKSRFICGQATPDCAALVPKPFECCIEDSCTSSNCAKDAESELVITMKNCKHKSYRHVSLLQVLHKTNDPCLCPDLNLDGPCYKNEDPIDLLTKVQTTLGAMVKKEMALATCKKKCGSSSEIEASFQRVNACKSAPTFNCTLG